MDLIKKYKEIVILVVIILGVFFYWQSAVISKQKNQIQELSSKSTFSGNIGLQEDCSKQAQNFFDYWENNSKTKQQDEFSNHYNTKLNKCFVLVKTYTQTNTNGDFSFGHGQDLYDAIEKKEYGSFSWTSQSPKKYWEVAPLWCEMYPDGNKSSLKNCQSEDEFDAFTKSYMED